MVETLLRNIKLQKISVVTSHAVQATGIIIKCILSLNAFFYLHGLIADHRRRLWRVASTYAS